MKIDMIWSYDMSLVLKAPKALFFPTFLTTGEEKYLK